jgi:hypothetical protein
VSGFLGLIVGLILKLSQRVEIINKGEKFSAQRIFLMLTILILAVGALYYFVTVVSNVDLSYTFETVFSKIGDGGGEERRDQWVALLDGISQNSGLGAGHGIGVSLVRSEQFPWKYELFPVAMVYRVGIVGFSLLVAPYLIYMVRFLGATFRREVSKIESFMFAGFLGMFVASATNPYPESFIFQWMLIGPMVLFEERRRNNKSPVYV